MSRAVLALAVLFCASTATASAPTVMAIIGEASNQRLDGQIAIACGIMNRPEGLQGVYGANISRRPSDGEIITAEMALYYATPDACERLIQGADMWHSGSPAPESWFDVPMLFVVKIQDHYFYRRLTSNEKNH